MLQDYKSVLKNKNFRFVWASQIFSQLTINIMNFIFLIRLFEATGSAISTALLWVAYSLPAILIGPFASAITDLLDKKKILVVTNFLQFLTILIFAFTPKTNIFLLYEIVFIYSLLNQFYFPSETSTLPAVLKKEMLVRGNSLFFITQQGSIILGYSVAGILRAVFGFDHTLLICSGFLFLAFISTLFLPEMRPNKAISKNIEKSVFGFFNHILDGYAFIKDNRKVLTPILLLIGFQVALQVCVVQVPVFAQKVLSIPLNSAGVYMLVPVGVGALIGAFAIPRILKEEVRKKKIIDYSLIMMGISLLILAYVVPHLPYTLKIIFCLFLLILIAFSYVGVLVPSQTFLQESTPKDVRGRVFGNSWFLVTALSMIPVVFSGSVTEVLGIRFLLFTFAMIVLIIFGFSKKFGDKFLTG